MGTQETIKEIVELTENYMQNVADLYEKEPKRYIEKIGMSHGKLIKKLREQKKKWANTSQV